MTKIRVFLIIFTSISKGHCLASNKPNNHVPNVIITSLKDDDNHHLTPSNNGNSSGSSTTRTYHIINFNHPTDNVQKIRLRHHPNHKNNKKQRTHNQQILHSSQLIQKVNNVIKTTFLPSGYPQRTPKGYLSYSMWSWIQDLSTQLRAVLATQRVLEGVGVGKEGATALSASLNFIIRDGCGMISTLVFTALASSRFRSDVKKWRILADVMNDIGITLEVAATLVPSHFFLPMICKFKTIFKLELI
jgi:hypothetical protein